MTLLFDMGPISCAHTDSALEALYKAMADQEDDQAARPHENPWIRQCVEDVTQIALGATESIREAIFNELSALMRPRSEPLAKAAPAWARWAPQEMKERTRQLESIPPADRTFDDWMMLAELIVHRYLPDHVIETTGEYMAVVAHLSGSIRAHLGDVPEDTAAEIARILPMKFRNIDPRVLTKKQAWSIRLAIGEACNYVAEVVDKVRNRMRQTVARWVRRITTGEQGATPANLQQELLDTFGTLNRDFRRIAITETGNLTNSAFISSLEPGTTVERMEAYVGACDFCVAIRGKRFEVVSDDHPDKNWETQVWPGKNNIGRSASPRKRIGNMLVPRAPEEMWSVPAGTVHPHCRGSWSVVAGTPAKVEKGFDEWARALLATTEPGRQ